MSDTNSTMVGGSHYLGQTIQVWDYVVANGIGYLEGNAIKYLSRWRQKGGLTDLRKALHYVQKLIEVEEARAPGPPPVPESSPPTPPEPDPRSCPGCGKPFGATVGDEYFRGILEMPRNDDAPTHSE